MFYRSLVDKLHEPGGLIYKMRLRRMNAFLRLVNPPAGARIIDLGGTPYWWNLLNRGLEVTLVNLPGEFDYASSPGKLPRGVKYVEGDACDLRSIFADKTFDVAFSNSVIEHVGGAERQRAFGSEVQRLADAYWVQTPSPKFPIEAHCGVPYFWRLPEAMRERCHRRWARRAPGFGEYMRSTTVLSRGQLLDALPGSRIYTERCVLIEKSNTAYLPCLPVGAPAPRRAADLAAAKA